MIFFDTESCGLTGPLTLIQTKRPGESPQLYFPWKEPVQKTLDLLESLCEEVVCAFNLTHDWFHVNKFYNLLKHYDGEMLNISQLAVLEEHLVKNNRHADWCLKPKDALDLFLFARCGPLQKLMVPKQKSDLRIKRVPKVAVKNLLKGLPEFDDIYQHYRGDAVKGWQQVDEDGEFVDLVYRFSPSMALKPLYRYIFNKPVVDFPIPKRDLPPNDTEYKPWGGWASYMHRHLAHWDKPKAIEYATNDVIYLEELWEYWEKPTPDMNSRLACQCGASRWRGFAINVLGIKHEINGKKMVRDLIPFRNQHDKVREYLIESSDSPEIAKIMLPDTRKETLEEFDTPEARQVINARRAEKRINILNKLLDARRFFPQFKIVGTKSNRMSGAGSLNPQGIQHDPVFRSFFTLADAGYSLSGGDFKSFEVAIADAIYNDNTLHAELSSGKNIHGLLGALLYEKPYEEIIESKEAESDEENYYARTKNCVFGGIFYGAQAEKVSKTAGISEEQAAEWFKKVFSKYRRVKKKRDEIFDRFQPIKQPDGIGTEVVWGEPDDYIESLLGFKRYFTLENDIIRHLFRLAQNIFTGLEGTVTRRDREQTIDGALRSALYACVFQLQQRNMRAANNHVIQATGAELCKILQDKLWNLQPAGVGVWRVSLFNVHDEIMITHLPELLGPIKKVIGEFIEEYKTLVPLIAFDWSENIENWSKK